MSSEFRKTPEEKASVSVQLLFIPLSIGIGCVSDQIHSEVFQKL